MSVVAAITQPLRAAKCATFLSTHGRDRSFTVLTGSPGSFDLVELPDSTDVRFVAPSPDVLPTGRLFAGRLTQAVINWARSGSTLGIRVERWIRAILWRLRYLDRFAVLFLGRRRSRAPADIRLRNSPVLDELRSIQEDDPIESIIVFDLFDLPACLEFAEEHDIEVLVR